MTLQVLVWNRADISEVLPTLGRDWRHMGGRGLVAQWGKEAKSGWWWWCVSNGRHYQGISRYMYNLLFPDPHNICPLLCSAPTAKCVRIQRARSDGAFVQSSSQVRVAVFVAPLALPSFMSSGVDLGAGNPTLHLPLSSELYGFTNMS